MQNFFNALAFLTRLGPDDLVEPPRIAASVIWYPVVGALLGMLCLLPPALLFPGLPWIQAWFYAGISLYLTRGLHWDGLADLADALGSGTRGENFWNVLKDSRTGAFGVLAICFCLAGMLIAAQTLFSGHSFAPLLLAPLTGRCACVLLAGAGTPNSPTSLAAPVIDGAGPCTLFFMASAILLPCALLLSFTGVCVLLLGLILLLMRLHALGRKYGGINGDFLGAAVVATELLTLFAGLL